MLVHDSYCSDHAKTLVDGVHRRRMGHLVWACAGKRDERGQRFNPLDVADVSIVWRLTKKVGVRSIVANPEGTARCALCEVDRRGGVGRGNVWADEILDTVLEVARRQGLVDRPVNRVQFSLVG